MLSSTVLKLKQYANIALRMQVNNIETHEPTVIFSIRIMV